MFNFFKKNESPKEENEYSFIWYKKLETKTKTHFTAPFRTKVTANSYDEAREKLIDFVLGKMQLVIVPEDKFNATELAKFQQNFDEISAKLDELVNSFNEIIYKKE